MIDRPFRDEPTEVLKTALGLADTHAQQAARFQPVQPGDELTAVSGLFRAELQHREGSVTSNCPNCQHPEHLPGTECDARIDHGPSRFHACLCLARPGAANACPPQMTCQGGTLGYADIWYLQHGHTLSSADGVISPEVLADGPASAAALSVPADADLRDRIAQVVRTVPIRLGPNALAMAQRGEPIILNMGEADAFAEALAPVLPAPADRTAIYREVAEELAGIDFHPNAKSQNLELCRLLAGRFRRKADEVESMADEAKGAAHRPHRGDVFERWLKAQRDAAADYPQAYQAADGLLDLYRLHADTGTLLDQHVCEGQAVGDCDCLEQPTVEVRQADTAGEGR